MRFVLHVFKSLVVANIKPCCNELQKQSSVMSENYLVDLISGGTKVHITFTFGPSCHINAKMEGLCSLQPLFSEIKFGWFAYPFGLYKSQAIFPYM